MTVTVDVQWALYGRAAGTAGFRVLSCSSGKLNRDNFGEAIGRFSPGTPDSLPQVTVSYVASGETDGNYLALAIHKYADADRDGRADETGRPVVFTSYFCVPYMPLASAVIGYLPLYLALRHARLPAEGSGAPLRITVAAATTVVPPAVGALAKQVAALLVTTGRPACVIGAHAASLAERLQFVDTVMAQLPYGQRTRMTAATWVRPTHRDHRFRLYFSDAARDHTPPDHVVWWGRPDHTALTPEHGSAYEYQRFLDDESRQSATRLSGLTNPYGFKLGDLREMLADLGITEPEHEAGEEDEARPAGPAQAGQATETEEHESGETVLEACAAHAKTLDLARLAVDIRKLKRLAASGRPTERQRARYRELITVHSLLKRHPELGEREGELYDALLTLGFGKPLSYQAYCQVEDCAGRPPGEPPHRHLLQAIERLGTEDVRVKAIALTTHLRDKQFPHKAFSSPLFDAVQLINLLAGQWERPQHFRIVCEATLQYLTSARDRNEQAVVQEALREHGFLAQAMQDSKCPDQYQVHILYRLLAAIYPDGFGRTAITAVLRKHPARPVTPALFAAVIRLAGPRDAQLARDAYAVASLTGLNLLPEEARRLGQVLPVLDQASGGSVSSRRVQPKVTRGGGTPADDVPEPGL